MSLIHMLRFELLALELSMTEHELDAYDTVWFRVARMRSIHVFDEASSVQALFEIYFI